MIATNKADKKKSQKTSNPKGNATPSFQVKAYTRSLVQKRATEEGKENPTVVSSRVVLLPDIGAII